MGYSNESLKPEIQDDIDEDNVEEVSEEIIPELVEADVINNLKAQSNFAQVIQLKATSTQELESVVDELKEMVKETNGFNLKGQGYYRITR